MRVGDAVRSRRTELGRTLRQVGDRVNAVAPALATALAGAGVLVVGLADQQARGGDALAPLLFWPGILLIVAPATIVLLQGAPAAAPEAITVRARRALPGAVSIGKALRLEPGSRTIVVGALASPVEALARGRRAAALEDPSGRLGVELRGRIRSRVEAGRVVAATGTLLRRRGRLILRVATSELRVLRNSAGPSRRKGAWHWVSPRDATAYGLDPWRSARHREPHAHRLRRERSRDERIALVLVVGTALYLVKLMTSPLGLTGPDEFTHWRTLEDILRTGHLFADNPLLRISPIYPGLEAAASSVASSTGLGVFPIAAALIGAAKIATLLAVFLVASTVTGSARVASIAALVYMANPSFLLFDAAFSYESLAIPLALVSIWATLQWVRHDGRMGLHAALALLTIAATAVTHHLTSLVLIAFYLLWMVVWVLRDRRRTSGRPIIIAGAWALACGVIWLVIAGTLALSYLGFIVQGGVRELIAILAGSSEARELFAQRPGLITPLPEVLTAYGAVLLLLAGLPLMLRHAIVGRRPSAVMIVFGLTALLYPPTLALRFTTLGAETSQRASEFLFLAIAILGADWLVGPHPTRVRLPRFLLAPILLVIFAGGVIAGAPLLSRLPGPYLVAAESRSIEPEGLQTATWVLNELGPDNRLIADRTNAKLLGAIGLQYPVTSANEHIGTAYVMFARTLGPAEIAVMRAARIKYVIADLRLSTDLPAYPFYFESAEPDAGNHKVPIPIEALEKFEGRPGVSRIYDSGDIRIYDVSGLVDAPQ
jgi:hypothetical protein